MSREHAELKLQDVPFTDPRVTVNKIPRMVSPKVGILKSLNHGFYRAQDPQSLAIGCGSADLSRLTEIENSPKAGGGGDKLEMALAAALGEMVERYCMYWYDKKDMIKSSYRELGEAAAHPEALRLYSEEQVRTKRPEVKLSFFTDDVEINWVSGWSLTQKRPIYVPATLVYLGYETEADEHVIGRNASTGLAAGATLEEAILSGLNECIERDAFTIAWMRRHVNGVIDIDDPQLNEIIRRRYKTDNPLIDLRIWDVTLDIPSPSLFGVLRRPAEFGYAMSLSSVSRTSPVDAVQKCSREIGQGFPYIRYLLDQLQDWEPAEDYSDLVTFDHHYTLYNKYPDLVKRNFAFCDSTEKRIPMSQMPDQSTGTPRGDVERLIELLDDVGLEVIVVDIATPDVRDLDLHVVRVLVPGLVPMHGNHNFPYLGVKRLHEVPKKLNWESEGWVDTGINPDPHPFP